MNKALRFARRSAALLLCLALLAGGALASTVRGDLSDRFEEPPTLEKDGQTYQYRRGLTTILLMGIDTRLEYDDVREGFRNGGQSDFLLLLVIDERNETVTPIHINRDVMTEITVLGVLGESIGTIETQLCLSHGFGDGKEESCEYTCDAVRNLLLGVDIDYYISMNLDGISELNDLMGGVTVTLNEDLTAFDPTMTAGTTMTLHGMQAEYFVRQRYYIGDGSNMGRMERQRQYMAEFAKLAYARLEVERGLHRRTVRPAQADAGDEHGPRHDDQHGLGRARLRACANAHARGRERRRPGRPHGVLRRRGSAQGHGHRAFLRAG